MPLLANLFLHLLDAAERDPRFPSRFLGRHARADIFRRQHLEVGLDLLVQVSLRGTRGEEVSQEASGLHKDRHAELLSPAG